MGSEIQVLNEYTAQIETAKTPEHAANLADNIRALRAAINASNQNKTIRDEAAKAAILAERQLGLLLQTLDLSPGRKTGSSITLESLGISKQRSQTAQKLAQIDNTTLEEYFERNANSDKYISIKSALKLLPPKQRVPTANLAQTYSAPPIDVEIARRIWGDLSEELIRLMLDSLNDALQNMRNPKHTQIWLLKHGIDPTDWTFTEPLSSAQIGVRLGKTREYIDNEYHRAKASIYEAMCIDAWRHILNFVQIRG